MNKQDLTLKDINEFLDEMRNSLTEYCVLKCKSKCCKKGKLLIQSQKELFSIIKLEDTKKLYEDNIIILHPKTDNWFYLDHEKMGGCPKLLENNYCSIHNNLDRPQICRDFPIFLKEKYIITADFCPAIKENLLERELNELKEMGFIIV